MYSETSSYFDIRFSAISPEGEHIKLIIDLEAQKEFYPGYSIAARGVFYGSRMISAQYGKEFTQSDYNSIKKVYSIWICMNAPKYAVNTITEYSLQPHCIYGEFKGSMKFDLMSVVIIGMGTETESGDGTELHKILSILFSERMTSAEKEKYLKEDYGFEIDTEMKGVWQNMCNLSELIEERAMQRGLQKGLQKGIQKGTYITLCKLVHSGKITPEEAAATAGISVEEMKEILEEQILENEPV